MDILKRKNGMNIVGQGGKIILFTLPSLIGCPSLVGGTPG